MSGGEQMVNIDLLQNEITDKGIEIDDLVKKLGIHKSSWYRKIKNPETFKIGDIEKLKEALSLSDEEATLIFLHKNSQKCEFNKEAQ